MQHGDGVEQSAAIDSFAETLAKLIVANSKNS